MFMSIGADCSRSGMVVCLQEACSKNIRIHLIMSHCPDEKNQNKKKSLIWLDSKKTLTLRDTEIERYRN